MIIGKAVSKEIRKKLMNNHIKTEQSLHAVMVVQFFVGNFYIYELILFYKTCLYFGFFK